MTAITPDPASLAAPRRPARKATRAARRAAVKVVSAVAVLLAAASLAWIAQILIPGDRATAILNMRNGKQQNYTTAELAPVKHEFGLDHPLVSQWLHYIGGFFTGDLGTSYTQYEPVTKVIGAQIVPSLVLTVSALVVAWVLALTISALTVKRGRVLRGLGSVFEAFTASLPHYWVGVILLVVFAVKIPVFPVISGSDASGFVLPVLTLAIPLSGFLGQVIRDELDKVLDQPFVTTARTRGMSDTAVRLSDTYLPHGARLSGRGNRHPRSASGRGGCSSFPGLLPGAGCFSFPLSSSGSSLPGYAGQPTVILSPRGVSAVRVRFAGS